MSTTDVEMTPKKFLQTNLIRYLPPAIKLHLLANPRILTEYQCICIHIPKTGGTTINKALDTLPERARTYYYKTQIDKHAKAVEIKALLGDELWNKFFTFAFVRNPWDLMVSSYHWWLQKAKDHNLYRGFSEQEVEQIKRMESFTDFMYSRFGQELINEYEGEIFDWISEDGKIIVDFVGKFETLQEDWEKICKQIGTQPTILPHENKTKRSSYQKYYTNETKEIVAKRFQRTIEAFNYDY